MSLYPSIIPQYSQNYPKIPHLLVGLEGKLVSTAIGWKYLEEEVCSFQVWLRLNGRYVVGFGLAEMDCII
jgi:hypothetical protein